MLLIDTTSLVIKRRFNDNFQVELQKNYKIITWKCLFLLLSECTCIKSFIFKFITHTLTTLITFSSLIHLQQLSVLEGFFLFFFWNKSRLLVQRLALTNPPSFTQTNKWILQAEEQSRNKSLDRMSMEAASLYYLYKAHWVLQGRDV